MQLAHTIPLAGHVGGGTKPRMGGPTLLLAQCLVGWHIHILVLTDYAPQYPEAVALCSTTILLTAQEQSIIFPDWVFLTRS